MGLVFTCSIDDGYPSDLKLAELLDKHGLRGTFFIPIRNREGIGVLSPSDIRELGTRFEIGSHTRDHCRLKNLDVRDAYDQIADGKQRLEDMLGREITGFCYPGGKYRRRDVELVRACGFHYARTTVNLCFDIGDRPFEMPTTVQFYPHDRAVYLRNFVGSGHWMKRHGGLLLALQHEHWLNRLFALFDHACEHGDAFHLWMHSRQIDELGAWHVLDGFFAYAAAHLGIGCCLTNEQLAARFFHTRNAGFSVQSFQP